MATRRAARERALGLAYESELRGLSAAALLAELPVEPDEYARRIVLGADDHRDDIDALIRKYSEHWSLERMPVIDRALLRLGTYELAWVIETPKGAVITEAVELAKQYSTKDSGRFVNGLLARISAEVRPEEVRPEEVRPEEVRSDDVDGPEDIDAE